MAVTIPILDAAAVQRRIQEIEAERDQFVQQANQQVAAFQGAINELRRLIQMPPEQLAEPMPAQSEPAE